VHRVPSGDLEPKMQWQRLSALSTRRTCSPMGKRGLQSAAPNVMSNGRLAASPVASPHTQQSALSPASAYMHRRAPESPTRGTIGAVPVTRSPSASSLAPQTCGSSRVPPGWTPPVPSVGSLTAPRGGSQIRSRGPPSVATPTMPAPASAAMVQAVAKKLASSKRAVRIIVCTETRLNLASRISICTKTRPHIDTEACRHSGA
jgi:hypothetical protein